MIEEPWYVRVWNCRADGHVDRHYEAVENEPAFDECEECGRVEYFGEGAR